MLFFAPPDFDRWIYPTSTPKPVPRIEIDVSEAPETKAWAEKARGVAQAWYGTICTLLATDTYKNPKVIRFVFSPKLNYPAGTANDTITFSAKWVTDHPEDFGVVIHELTHVIQQYPGSPKTPGWIVEGIADYIRWLKYEPAFRRPRLNLDKARYQDGYGTAATFLDWAGSKYDLRLIPSLDRSMRKGEDPMPWFEKFTGKDVDTLWKEFIDTLRGRA
jgi:hypothetical protein